MKMIYLILVMATLSQPGNTYQSNLNGKITNDYGQALERAWVLVLNAHDLSYVTGTVTDANGYFEIEDVEEGDYVISLHHNNFEQPKTLGNWKTESHLNGLSKMQMIQIGDEVTVNKYRENQEVYYTFELDK